MKYLVILYAKYNNGTSDKKAIYEAITSSAAVALFHSYMGSYMKDDTVDHVLVMAVNSDGGILNSESWTRPTDATETEITE